MAIPKGTRELLIIAESGNKPRCVGLFEREAAKERARKRIGALATRGDLVVLLISYLFRPAQLGQ
jgi:hypothetical protein